MTNHFFRNKQTNKSRKTATNLDKATVFGGGNKYCCKRLEVQSHRSGGGGGVRGCKNITELIFG